jgi:hypothetical protein
MRPDSQIREASPNRIQLARRFGFDLVEMLLDPGVTGTAVEGEGQ